MNQEPLLVETQGSVATLTLNRPEKRNSLTPDLLQKLRDSLDGLAGRDDIRAVVLTGTGEKAFSSGFDVASLPARIEEEDAEEPDTNPLEVAVQGIVRYPYPVIAMINGHAFGAGCELALSCDLRVAADDIRMGLPPAKLGLIYPLNGMLRIVQRSGLQAARELFFTGRILEPARIRELRLVDYQIPRQTLPEFTAALAEEIAGNAPLSLKGTKFVMRAIENSLQLTESERAEIKRLTVHAFNSEDCKEGLSAFWEKRKPIFRGC